MARMPSVMDCVVLGLMTRMGRRCDIGVMAVEYESWKGWQRVGSTGQL